MTTQRVEHLARKTIEIMMEKYEPGTIKPIDRVHLADFIAHCIAQAGEWDESYTAFEVGEAMKFIRARDMVDIGHGSMLLGKNWHWPGKVKPVLLSLDHKGRVSHVLFDPDNY